MKPTWNVKDIDEQSLNNISSILEIDKYMASILIAKGNSDIINAYNFLNPKYFW